LDVVIISSEFHGKIAMTRALPLLIALAGLSMFAQTVTDIDTRGKPGTGPAGHPLESSGGQGRIDTTTLKAVFMINDPNSLKPGNRFDYEMVITNQGKDTVSIPQTLNWEDVETGSDDQPYLWANVDIRVTAGNLEGSIADDFRLYGAEDKPSTEVVLRPGDSVRILGWVMLPLNMSINKKRIRKATLEGAFHLGTGWLHRTHTLEFPDAYRTEEVLLSSASASERYPTDLETEP
jgi:hypothetical protein